MGEPPRPAYVAANGCQRGRGRRNVRTEIATVPLLVLALATFLAFVSCAHGGGIVYQSPRSGGDQVQPTQSGRAVDLEQRPRREEAAVGGAAIVPDPAMLGITNDPDVHHPLDLVSSRSAVITANQGGWPIVIHNDAGLLGEDGCSSVALAPEGDTRLTLILPEPGVEAYSRFYLVGCGSGDATLTIMSEGETLNTYTFTVADR